MDLKVPNDSTFRKKLESGNIEEWGAREFEIAKRKIKEFRTCLDIGAHIGLTTRRFASHFKAVHSFEPLLTDYLTENTSMLQNVTVYPNAVTDKPQTLKMYRNEFNSGCGMVEYKDMKTLLDQRYKNEKSRHFGIEPVEVQGITIDSLKLLDIDFIKIDVEGYNIPVLEGMKKTLQENDPVIQIETHPENTQVETKTQAILEALGYIRYHETKNKPQDWFYYKA
jgi:FkbM family methyltransferase